MKGQQRCPAKPIRCTLGQLSEESRYPSRETLSAAKGDNQGNALLLSEYGSQAHRCHARRGEHLTAPGNRSFAALRMTIEGHRMTSEGVQDDKRGRQHGG